MCVLTICCMNNDAVQPGMPRLLIACCRPFELLGEAREPSHFISLAQVKYPSGRVCELHSSSSSKTSRKTVLQNVRGGLHQARCCEFTEYVHVFIQLGHVGRGAACAAALYCNICCMWHKIPSIHPERMFRQCTQDPIEFVYMYT